MALEHNFFGDVSIVFASTPPEGSVYQGLECFKFGC